jgi:hypothetical protein
MYVQAFNPVNGLSIEFKYDKEAISQAIATQVSTWVNGIAFSFLGLCEAAVESARHNYQLLDQSIVDAQSFVWQSAKETAVNARSLAAELLGATRVRVKRHIMELIQPPFNAVEQQYVAVRNQVREVLTAYIEGAAAEPIQLSAVSKEPIMLSSVNEALQGLEVEEVEEIGHIPNGLESGATLQQVQSAEVVVAAQQKLHQAGIDYQALDVRSLRNLARGKVPGFMRLSAKELAQKLAEQEGAVV